MRLSSYAKISLLSLGKHEVLISFIESVFLAPVFCLIKDFIKWEVIGVPYYII
jgi:hypothetical protein